MLDKARIIGMGYFARSHTLRLRFLKVLQDFTWLRFEDLCPAAERMFNSENVRRFFGSVIRSGTERPDQIHRALESVSAATKINGFYLGMDDQSMYLIVFFQDAACQTQKLTIRLEKFNQLRKIRLH